MYSDAAGTEQPAARRREEAEEHRDLRSSLSARLRSPLLDVMTETDTD